MNSKKCSIEDKDCIAVLLTVHNRKIKTLSCLEKLFKENSNKYVLQVYLTDDGCTDSTKDAVKSKWPEVEIIDGDGSLFWNRGMRAAWERAAVDDPDFYLWLNDDTELMSDSIQRLLDCSKGFENRAIIVGSTYESKDKLDYSYGGRLKIHNNPRVYPDKYIAKKCDVFNGNIVLIPRYVFDIVGYNDNYYRHSFGDFDYGISAGLKGIESYVAPGYYGYCKRNNPIPLFRRKCNNLVKRYKLLYSPWGYNPFEDFHLNIKYQPFYKCIWYFIKLHINVLFTINHIKYEPISTVSGGE